MAETPQGNNTEARLLSDERFLRKVSNLYYEDGHSQEVVADLVSCSRQTVGKALQKARERGIVRITVMPEARHAYLRNLSRDGRVQLDIIATAAEYLDQLLTEDDVLAVSGGKHFMRGLIRYIRPEKQLPLLQVVPTIGFAQPHTGLGDANLISFDLAQAYGARHVWFPCPAIFSEKQQLQSMLALPAIRAGRDLMDRASVVVTSLFTTHKDEDLIQSGVVTREQLALFDDYRPVVDINHWAFDSEGRCINNLINPPPFHLSGLNIPRLKDQIQHSDTKVMLVVGGSPGYIPAIRAVLRAKIVNILITDHVTAQQLIERP